MSMLYTIFSSRGKVPLVKRGFKLPLPRFILFVVALVAVWCSHVVAGFVAKPTPFHGVKLSPNIRSSTTTCRPNPSFAPLHVLRDDKATVQQDEAKEDEQGSVLGASLLFAGTAIGAGMLALPAETAPAGFWQSEASLVLCWAFTYVTSLVTLEASWTVGQDKETEGAGFLSIGKTTLGPAGAIVTALLFWFLLTSIIVAYTSEGGTLISQAAAEISGLQLNVAIGSTAFMAFFASLAIFGTERVDVVNRILVTGLLGTFFGLVGIGLPSIDSQLLSRGDWGAVYPSVISVGILSFGAQNVVPTLLEYLGRDTERTKRAVLIGSLIPLIMYSLWEAVFLGMVPYDPNSESKMEIMTALGEVGGTIVKDLVEVFSACSIGSSMAGASVSLVDFFQDAISGKKYSNRLVAALLALGPPLGLACAFPGAFLSALENAGLLGGVSLYGVLPALAVMKLRSSRVDDDKGMMPGRLVGGTPALYGILAVSAALLLPEVVRLVEVPFSS